MPVTATTLIPDVLEEDALWVEFGQRRKSVPQNVSAVQLWGRAADVAGLASWPPTWQVLDVFCFSFRNDDSLAKCTSHLKSALQS